MSSDHRLYLIDGALVHGLDSGKILWDVAIKDLLLIAEYTTNEGPVSDDYFLVFWSLEAERLFKMQCSFYAVDAIETMETLLKRITASTTLGLASSTEWNSRILWPTELAGKPYFEQVEVVPVTFKARISKVILGASFEFPPTAEVQAYLRRFLTTSASIEG